MKQYRGKIVFAPFVSADDLEPIVREFASRGYMGEGMTTTLSQGLYSVVIRGYDTESLIADIDDICKDRDDMTVHYSITSVYSHAKGQTLREFLQSFKEGYDGHD